MTYIALSHNKLFAFRIYCSGGAAPPKTPQTSTMAPFQTPASPAFNVLVSSRRPYVQ
jgi:hypothetical protein